MTQTIKTDEEILEIYKLKLLEKMLISNNFDNSKNILLIKDIITFKFKLDSSVEWSELRFLFYYYNISDNQKEEITLSLSETNKMLKEKYFNIEERMQRIELI